jgi:hypothetical protein
MSQDKLSLRIGRTLVRTDMKKNLIENNTITQILIHIHVSQ